MARHRGKPGGDAKFYLIPQHCNGACGLQHNVPFPFSMKEGKKWGRHVVMTTVIRRSKVGYF